MADFISVINGAPGAFGVISAPFTVRECINIFLEGCLPTENMRFREEALIYRISDDNDIMNEGEQHHYKCPSMSLSLGDFYLEIHLKIFFSQLSFGKPPASAKACNELTHNMQNQ